MALVCHSSSRTTCVFLLLLSTLLATTSTTALVVNSNSNNAIVSARRHPQQLKGAHTCRRFDVVIVDVENLRGKSGFAISHNQLLQTFHTYISTISDLSHKFTLAIDHGNEPSTFWMDDDCYSLVFAGPHCKADDTIANELVPFFRREGCDRILVVTGDYELRQRCRRNARNNVEVLAPQVLLADLEKIIETYSTDFPAATTIDGAETDEGEEPSGLVDEYELYLGAQLLEVEALLKQRAGMNNKRRKKLRLKGQKIWRKLEQVSPRMLERIVDVLKEGVHCESLVELSKSEQTILLSKWLKVQNSRRRRETTQDRVVLAENLRQELLEKYGERNAIGLITTSDTTPIISACQAYVLSRQRQASLSDGPDLAKMNLDRAEKRVSEIQEMMTAEDSNAAGALRLVVIADTHGFEEQLGQQLPEGDVLLHLGDFSMDRSPNVAENLVKFDSWLAQQRHRIKIVLRGNHDPRNYEFSRSSARYITHATVKEIAGYSFAFVPFLSGGLRRKKGLPRKCDVLVSHVPPKSVLDRCDTGKYAGSRTLLKAAQSMSAGPPRLWLCGHIHESRGVSRHHVFCMNKETIVVNAANANPGIAKKIEYGPVVLQLGEDRQKSVKTKQRDKVQILKMEGQYEFMNQRNRKFFTTPSDGNRHILMAVDLGLKTGISLFDDQGKLIRCDSFQFESPQDLRDGAKELLREWESAANQVNSNSITSTKVSHIAIEGADPPLIDAWKQASSDEHTLLYVRPEEWRCDLLDGAERRSGESSKAASRIKAQQIMSNHGLTVQCENPLDTDMAESVLLGLHVARRLGWGEVCDPPVCSDSTRGNCQARA